MHHTLASWLIHHTFDRDFKLVWRLAGNWLRQELTSPKFYRVLFWHLGALMTSFLARGHFVKVCSTTAIVSITLFLETVPLIRLLISRTFCYYPHGYFQVFIFHICIKLIFNDIFAYLSWNEVGVLGKTLRRDWSRKSTVWQTRQHHDFTILRCFGDECHPEIRSRYK